MTSLPPTKNAGFIFGIELPSVAYLGTFQTNPTLVNGDVKISIDGEELEDIATLPVVTPAGSTRVEVVLSAAEMSGDNISVFFVDAAGAEWSSKTAHIQTSDVYTKVDELHKLEGLDADNPVTTTPKSRVAGSISQTITGDGITISTVTRP